MSILKFASTNTTKIKEFELLNNNRIQKYFDIEYVKIPEFPEIQGTAEEVATEKVKNAYKFLNCPCIIDDESFYVDALNGFPGPYLKDYEKALKAKGIYEVMNKLENYNCFTQVIYAFTSDGMNVELFKGITYCKSLKPRDDFQLSERYWESIAPIEKNKRFSIIEIDELNDNWYMRKQAIDLFINYLDNYFKIK